MTGKHSYLLDQPPTSESEALFRGLFENSSDAIQILDNFTFVECNQATVKILRARNKEEVLAAHPSQLSPEFQPDGRLSSEKADEMIRTALEKGGHRFEWMHRRVDGEDFPVEVILTPVSVGGKTLLYSSWRDIADRKQLEAFLRSMVENAPEAVGTVDLTTGLFTDPNENAVKLYGLAREELVKVGPADMSPPFQPDGRSSTEKALEKINQAMQGGTIVFEWVHLNSRGEEIPCEVRLIRLPGDPPRVRFSVTDITERKQLEQALRASQQLLQSVMDNIPQAVFWKDQDLRYLGCNQAFAEDAGLTTPQHIVGKTDYDMPWTAQAEAYRADDRLVMKSGTAKINYEEPQTTPTGEIIWLRTSKIPMRDAAGNVTAVLGMYEDITERKQIESNLQESEERFRRFSEATTEGLVFHDKGVILDANPAVVAMFGFTTAAELVGRNLLEFIVPDSRQLVLQKMQLDDVHPYEVKCIRKDGLTFPAETSTRAYQYGERAIRASAVRDITARKQAEMEIARSVERQQKLTQRMRAAIEAADELMRAPDLDTLYRRVVELAREKLGVERCSLFIADPTNQFLLGTYGTDDHGQTTDERTAHEPIEQHQTVFASQEKIWVAQEAPQRYRTKNEEKVVGTGWVGGTAIRSGTTPIGILYNDAAISGSPVDTDLQETLAVYCSMLGGMIESKRLEQELTAAQRQFQNIIEFLPDATFVIDRDKRVIAWNKAIEEMSGLAKEDILGQGDYAYAVPFFGVRRPIIIDLIGAPNEEIEAKYDFVQRQGDTLLAEVFVPTMFGGRGAHVAVTASPLRDDAGNYVGAIESIRDITDRRRLELQIRESLARRDVQVQTSVEVAQEIAAAPEEGELFHRVVTLIKERFNYYHAQLFRYDPAQKAVVLMAGYGEIGARMLTAGHRLPMGRGVVGTAADTGRSILAADVTQDEDWRPNPHLPETKGELAVPIKLRDEVLGILDVQSDRVGALTDDDRLLLEGLCGQIAIVMESTRLLEQLRRNEADLSEALKIAELAYWEYAVEKDLFFFNDQFYSIFHTTAEQVGGYQISSAQYAQQFVHPDDLPIVGAEIEKALNSTERHYHRKLEHRILYADGGVGYISVDINIDRDEQGKILRYYGANQDITDRKLAEEELRSAHSELAQAMANVLQFKSAFEHTNVGMAIVTTDGRFVSANQALCDLVGYTRDELQLKRFGELTHPDDVASSLAYLRRALAGEIDAFRAEKRYLHKNGDVIWIELSTSLLRDSDQQPLYFISQIQDIRQRKQAEETLRHNEAQLSEALKIAKLGYWEYDVEKDLFFFNDQFYSIFHTMAEQVGGYQISSAQYAQHFVHPDDLPIVGAEIEKALNSTDRHYTRQLEHRIRYADGGEGYISVSINIDRDEQGRILRYYGANQDITERKRIEAALAQEQSLMRALMDTVNDHLYFKDAESRFLRVSKSQADRFGLSDPAEAAGKTDFDFFTEEHARPAYEDEQEIIRTGQPISKEERETWPDQPDTWVLTSKFPLRDETNNIIGTFGISVDITGRKQAEVERERLLADQQKRSLQLQTASEVSRAASSILDLNELLPQAAALIRERFGLYYVGIFLTDETGRWATLHAGTGEAGRQMLSNGHKLKIGGNSMISQCIELQQARIALDVGEAAVRFDNPLLPLTRSEMALPLISRGRVMGAMTIQSDQPAAFSADDITVLQSMADQISNAVENARLYDQARTALQEVDAINRRLTGEAWDTYLRQQAGREIIWLADDDTTAPEPLAQLDEQLTTGEITVEPDLDDESEATVTAPILLRGQPIGALRLRTPLSEWNQDTQVMLSDITGHIAQAVENARLIEQTQRTAQRERMINEINARVRQSVDLEAILRTAVNELGQSLKAARVVARVGTMTADGAAVTAGDGRGKTND